MALERESIEKKDFQIGGSGYDPQTVDSHLRFVADEVEELKRTARRRSEMASDQVRAIVEAAESSAAAIQRQAEDEAQETRAHAASAAQSTREQAAAQAREYVGKVSESTTTMLQRLDAMESELSATIDSLRTGASSLRADLHALEGSLSESGQLAASPAAESAPASPAAETVLAPIPESLRAEHPTASPAAETVVAPASETPADSAATGTESAGDDTEGARLIALNMALNGTPRDEADRYLAENFQLAHRGRLLDEVYASVEG